MTPAADATTAARRVARIVLGAALALFAGAAGAQGTALTVYTPFDARLTARYDASLRKEVPDLRVRWMRGGEGELTARILAERKLPKADAIFGLAATSLEQIEAAGGLERYAPAELGALDARYRDDADEPSWVGLGVHVGALCYHSAPGRRAGAPRPANWFDLARKEYAGAVAMPDPRASSAGYLHVAGWLQIFEERNGWLYQNALFQNVVAYTKDAVAPCRRAGSGAVAVGISTVRDVLAAREQRLPVELIFPSDRVGWDVAGAAIVAGTRRRAPVRAFIDWAVSAEAAEVHRTEFGILARSGVRTALRDWPGGVEARLARNDPALLGRERARILRIWGDRYGTKAER